MAKPKGSPLAASDEPLYALGQQLDGSFVVRIPDDSHLVTAIQAFDKQSKNATAATGTIAALKPGMSDPIIALVLRELEALKQSFMRARSGQLQISDTPIGKEMEANGKASEIDKRDARAARKVQGEQVDGAPAGVTWAEHTPTPRPKIGDKAYAARSLTGAPITKINGYDEATQSFLVSINDGDILYGVYSHGDGWRLRGETYDDASAPAADGSSSTQNENGVDTSGQSAADELLDAAKDSTQLLDGEAASDRSAYAGGDDVAVDTDAAGEPRSSKTPVAKKAAKGSFAQRARNESANGLRKGAAKTPAKKGGRGR
jgi:hypothetical protein